MRDPPLGGFPRSLRSKIAFLRDLGKGFVIEGLGFRAFRASSKGSTKGFVRLSRSRVEGLGFIWFRV